MILVTLGTQDKDFSRLLKAVEKQIKNGNIKEKVVAQIGTTKYASDVMETFDLIPSNKFDDLMSECSILITHGGVGSILTGLKNNKKVIAAARLHKYGEHVNDHQLEIIDKFTKAGYILELKDFDRLDKVLKKCQNFRPKKFKSNTCNFLKLIEDYIDEDNHVSWYNKYREVLLYLVFGGLTTLVNIVSFFILRHLAVEVYLSNMLAWVIAVLFAFITNKLFVFESRGKSRSENIREMVSFFGFRVLSLGADMSSMYLLLQVLSANELISKIVANIIVIILNYIFSKLIIFKK